MVRHEGVNIGRMLVLIGGVLMIVFGLIHLISAAVPWPFSLQMPRFYSIGAGFVAGIGFLAELVAGVIAVVGSKKAEQLVWTILLLIIGLLVGGWGGILVAIGTLIALVSYNM